MSPAKLRAIECGITVCPVAPKDPPPDGAYDAVLYDWDCLPLASQKEVMSELRSGTLLHAGALHGHNLEYGQVAALERDTVAVFRRLHPRVFRSLRQAVIAVRAAKASGHEPDDEHTTSQSDEAA